MWEFTNDRPIYLQLIEQIKLRVINGTYKPGDKVPSVREIAMEAGVNPNTMQRALSELEREGLLASWRTSGRFVTEDKEKLEALREQLGRQYVEELFQNLRELGFTDDLICHAVQIYSRGEINDSLV